MDISTTSLLHTPAKMIAGGAAGAYASRRRDGLSASRGRASRSYDYRRRQLLGHFRSRYNTPHYFAASLSPTEPRRQ